MIRTDFDILMTEEINKNEKDPIYSLPSKITTYNDVMMHLINESVGKGKIYVFVNKEDKYLGIYTTGTAGFWSRSSAKVIIEELFDTIYFDISKTEMEHIINEQPHLFV